MIYFGSEFWAAIVGAIVGSASGAIPAYLLARKASKEEAERIEAERAHERRLAGIRFYSVLTSVANDTLSTRQQIEWMINSRDESKLHKRVSALAGARSEIQNPFAQLDLSVFANKSGIDLINRVDLLGRAYETQIALLHEFRAKKERLFEIYESAKERHEGADGKTTYRIAGDQQVVLADREAQAESVAQGLVELTRMNSGRAYRLAKAYDLLAASELKELELPRIDLSAALLKFDDLETSDQEQPK